MGHWAAGPPPGRPAQGAPLPRTGLGICQDADLPGWFPRMAAALGAAYTLAGRVADALPLLTQALAQISCHGNESTSRRSVVSPWGRRSSLAGHLEEAQPLAERALALARAHQEQGHQAYALRLLGEIAARRDPPEAGQAEATTSGPRPSRGAGHAPAPGPLPSWPGHLYAKIG